MWTSQLFVLNVAIVDTSPAENSVDYHRADCLQLPVSLSAVLHRHSRVLMVAALVCSIRAYSYLWFVVGSPSYATTSNLPLQTLPLWSLLASTEPRPKLWKHHGAHAQARDIQRTADEQACAWVTERYPGGVDAEWLHPKVLEVYDEAPTVFEATAAFVEAGDWIVWKLTADGATTGGGDICSTLIRCAKENKRRHTRTHTRTRSHTHAHTRTRHACTHTRTQHVQQCSLPPLKQHRR